VSFRVKAQRAEVEESPHFVHGCTPSTPRPQQEPHLNLTPTQQLLDQRLRDWRTAEAERLGLPQFFVLGTSTLRSIVLAKPQSLAELRSIDGINVEKAERFGASILELCNG